MKSGLLWYDADEKKPLNVKITEAAQRYYQKFGLKPNQAYVNPVQLKAFADGRDPLTYKMPCAVSPRATILPNHIWLGVV